MPFLTWILRWGVALAAVGEMWAYAIIVLVTLTAIACSPAIIVVVTLTALYYLGLDATPLGRTHLVTIGLLILAVPVYVVISNSVADWRARRKRVS